MRRPVIAGNWKMFKTEAETRAFLRSSHRWLKTPSTAISSLPRRSPPLQPQSKPQKAQHITVAAQNLHWEREGAFTGEISMPMLVEAGCQYVILGHSERRHLFRRDRRNRPKKSALLAASAPIVCVGERSTSAKATITSRSEQPFEGGFASLTDADFSRILFAYEPVWAIGTGHTATPEIAEDAHRFISELAQNLAQLHEPPPAHPLWRQRQARQYQGPDGAAGYRWRPRRRRQPRREIIRVNCEFLSAAPS